jgi:2,3-dihydroxybenzoate-AMP ligase
LSRVRDALRRREVAAHKLPDRLVLVEAIPTTNVGKMDKKALRADIAHRIEQEQSVSPGV